MRQPVHNDIHDPNDRNATHFLCGHGYCGRFAHPVLDLGNSHRLVCKQVASAIHFSLCYVILIRVGRYYICGSWLFGTQVVLGCCFNAHNSAVNIVLLLVYNKSYARDYQRGRKQLGNDKLCPVLLGRGPLYLQASGYCHDSNDIRSALANTVLILFEQAKPHDTVAAVQKSHVKNVRHTVAVVLAPADRIPAER